MIGITVEGITRELAVDIRTTSLGMLIFFQDHDSSTVAEYKSITIDIKGATCRFWIVVPGR